MTRAWPATLAHGRVGLRPIRQRDALAWREVRLRNGDWLAPWEASVPPGSGVSPSSYASLVRHLRAEAREGRCWPWVVTYDGRLVGQVTVGGITWGSLCSAHIGYWVDQAVAGRGIIPTAVAMAADHAFAVGLHRVEINIRPENSASRRVVEKLGFRLEGTRTAYLHIGGRWCDHLSYALLAEEVPGGVLSRWISSGIPAP